MDKPLAPRAPAGVSEAAKIAVQPAVSPAVSPEVAARIGEIQAVSPVRLGEERAGIVRVVFSLFERKRD